MRVTALLLEAVIGVCDCQQAFVGQYPIPTRANW